MSLPTSHSKKIASSISLPQAHLPKANAAKNLPSWLLRKTEPTEPTMEM